MYNVVIFNNNSTNHIHVQYSIILGTNFALVTENRLFLTNCLVTVRQMIHNYVLLTAK